MGRFYARWLTRIRDAGRRWLPGLFIRVTRKDITDASAALDELTDEEVAAGREAARRAIEAARARRDQSPDHDA
jgi:hypothetical protein